MAQRGDGHRRPSCTMIASRYIRIGKYVEASLSSVLLQLTTNHYRVVRQLYMHEDWHGSDSVYLCPLNRRPNSDIDTPSVSFYLSLDSAILHYPATNKKKRREYKIKLRHEAI
jgi:hypothetical protein